MQEIILAGLQRNENESIRVHDRTPNPLPSVKNAVADDKRYSTLSRGLFEEVKEKKQYEQYGRFILNTESKKLIKLEAENNFEFLIDPVVFAWSVDPLAHKYPSWSPYAAFANNPIIYVDTDGREVFYFLSASAERNPGHAAIAVENYTTVIIKGETFYRKTGTVSIYHLAATRDPKKREVAYGIGVDAVFSNPNTDSDEYIKQTESFIESTMKDYDGLLRINTTGKSEREDGLLTEAQVSMDLKVKAVLENLANTVTEYNAEDFNCATYVFEGLKEIFPKNPTLGNETAKKGNFAGFSMMTFKFKTPNQLWNDLSKLSENPSSNIEIIKDPGNYTKFKFQNYKGRENE